MVLTIVPVQPQTCMVVPFYEKSSSCSVTALTTDYHQTAPFYTRKHLQEKNTFVHLRIVAPGLVCANLYCCCLKKSGMRILVPRYRSAPGSSQGASLLNHISWHHRRILASYLSRWPPARCDGLGRTRMMESTSIHRRLQLSPADT